MPCSSGLLVAGLEFRMEFGMASGMEFRMEYCREFRMEFGMEGSMDFFKDSVWNFVRYDSLLFLKFFRGRCLWIFCAVLHFPYHAGMEFGFFALCFSNKFFSIHFSMCFFLLAGRSFCCAPREPHGQEFSIDSRSGFSACQSQSACRAHGVSWALQRDLYPWPRGFSCVFILKFLGFSDLGSSFSLPRLHEF